MSPHFLSQQLDLEVQGVLELSLRDLVFSDVALNGLLVGTGIEVVSLEVRRLELSPREVRGVVEGVRLVLRPSAIIVSAPVVSAPVAEGTMSRDLQLFAHFVDDIMGLVNSKLNVTVTDLEARTSF